MFKNSFVRLKEVRVITMLAMMSALYVVLYMAKIPLAMESRVSLTFLPVVAAGYLSGPVGACVVGIIGDIVGSLLFPQGAYFPGFTLSAAINGLILGGFFYKAKSNITLKSFVANFIAILFVNVFLNTVWVSILYEKAFAVYFYSRVIKNILVYPVQAFLSIFIIKLLDNSGISKKYKN